MRQSHNSMVGAPAGTVDEQRPWDGHQDMAVRNVLTPAQGLVMGYRMGERRKWYHWGDSPTVMEDKGKGRFLAGNTLGEKFDKPRDCKRMKTQEVAWERVDRSEVGVLPEWGSLRGPEQGAHKL